MKHKKDPIFRQPKKKMQGEPKTVANQEKGTYVITDPRGELLAWADEHMKEIEEKYGIKRKSYSLEDLS